MFIRNLLTLSFILWFSFYSQSQTLHWAKALGSVDVDYGFGVAYDAAGNVYTTGYFSGVTDFDPGVFTYNLTPVGQSDIYILKLNSYGDFVWAKNIGGTANDFGFSIFVDSDANVYTTGIFNDTADFDPGTGTLNLTSAGSSDVFISKLDSTGNFVWANRIGGTNSEYGQSITSDLSGNIYLSGNFNDTVDFDPGPGVFSLVSSGDIDIFVSKYDSSGNFIWARKMGGPDFDYGHCVKCDLNGDVYTTGYFGQVADFDPGSGNHLLTSNGGSDIYISKLDSAGNFIWAKHFGGTSNDFCHSLQVDSSGNVYTTGAFQDSADFDPGTGIFNLSSIGVSDIFISKFDPNGNFIWAKSMGGYTNDNGWAITSDIYGDIYAIGHFKTTADLDPGAGVNNLVSTGNDDIFISKYDDNGNFIWAKKIGGPDYDFGNSISVNDNGNIYITGVFRATANFNHPAFLLLTSHGSYDFFVSKYTQLGLGIEENTPRTKIEIYPNPTQGRFKIQFPTENLNTEIRVSDVLGQEISNRKFYNASQIDLEIEGNNGMYFIYIKTTDNSFHFKILKQ